jgi:hypothetical protein
MKRLFASALLLLGNLCVAQAQVNAPTQTTGQGNAAQDISGTSAMKGVLGNSLAVDALSQPLGKTANTFGKPIVATALALPLDTADPAAPSPKPRFLYGGRDDYRWQLALGVSWLRFQSSVFNASAVGINTSVTYFTNDWFGVEGNLTAVFAPTILVNEHVKIATYGGGPKIAWRQKQWEPWLHGIFGGAHEQPQIVGSSRNTYCIKAGGGADYRWNPRVSFRLEGDYVRTAFFQGSQNDFQLAGGIVFHF